MSIEIEFNDFSDGSIQVVDGNPTWEGTGAFDKLMEAINGNIKIQYETGRIKGPEYANVYLGSMQTAINRAFDYMLQKQLLEKDIVLKEKDIVLKEKQIESLTLDDVIKEEQHEKDLVLKYVQQVKLDKETAMLGLDTVVKDQNKNITTGHIYTPKYVE